MMDIDRIFLRFQENYRSFVLWHIRYHHKTRRVCRAYGQPTRSSYAPLLPLDYFLSTYHIDFIQENNFLRLLYRHAHRQKTPLLKALNFLA